MSIDDRFRRMEAQRSALWAAVIEGRLRREPQLVNDLINAAFEYGQAVGLEIGQWQALIATRKEVA